MITPLTRDPIWRKGAFIPDELTVEIPSALSADVSMYKSTMVDTLKGREIYGHLRFFIHTGDHAARITRHVIQCH